MGQKRGLNLCKKYCFFVGMDQDIRQLGEEFLDFFYQRFKCPPGTWAITFNEAFNAVNLSPTQKAFLLNAANSTPQFHSSFRGYIQLGGRYPEHCVMMTFLEPINKLATYFEIILRQQPITSTTNENALLYIVKLAAIAQTMPKNLRIILGDNITEEISEIYDELAALGKKAEIVLEKHKRETTVNVGHLAGMHYALLAEGFSTGPH